MQLGARLVRQTRRLSLCSTCVMIACAPAKPHVAPPGPIEPPAFSRSFKRVDAWTFELERPPSLVEAQLKQTFERVFAHAQYSKEYTCLAREQATFYERYKAKPNEELEQHLIGRCGAAGATASFGRVYYSDGTILDGPLSDEMLIDVSKRLAEGLPEFTVFGITARYDGPNMLVWLATGSPSATMNVGIPDAERRVSVSGEVFGPFSQARALINQGDVETAYCDNDDDVQWPRYAFTCTMAPGDDEAWISLLANSGDDTMEHPLIDLPARGAGWLPPSEYRRHQLALPGQIETRTALLSSINELRGKAGKRPLDFAADQSAYLQHTFPQEFKRNATGNWKDEEFGRNVLRGDHVGGPVAWGRIASGIAFDGDAADWLAYRLMLPVSRNTLMLAAADEIAIATDGDRNVGFGAVAVVYQLLTPEREAALGDGLADTITKVRNGRFTKRLENPPELVDAAREVGEGTTSLKELAAALARSDLALKGPEHIASLYVDLGGVDPDVAELQPLLEAEKLRFGILVTHVTEPNYGWARPVAVVWFLTDERPQRQAGEQRQRGRGTGATARFESQRL
jgi:hypothetical protein